jgi:hypothetical protein
MNNGRELFLWQIVIVVILLQMGCIKEIYGSDNIKPLVQTTSQKWTTTKNMPRRLTMPK